MAARESPVQAVVWSVAVLVAIFWFCGVMFQGGVWALAVAPDVSAQEILGVVLGALPLLLIYIGIRVGGAAPRVGRVVQLAYTAFLILDLAVFASSSTQCGGRGGNGCGTEQESVGALAPAVQPALLETIVALVVPLIGYGIVRRQRRRRQLRFGGPAG